MKLGINTVFLAQFKFADGLRFAQELDIEVIEIATVGAAKSEYCDLDKLLGDRGELQRWLDALRQHGLEISALAVHGDPLSPNEEAATEYRSRFRKACKLAEKAGIDRLTTNAGLPEATPGETTPVWVVDTTKPYNRRILRWQWEERLIPFWREHAKIAEDHGCLVAIEPWIGDIVYSPMTLMQLREAVGPVIGCNLDPAHMIAQQIDLPTAIRYIANAIYHVHIKDCRFDPRNLGLRGVLDPTPLDQPENRAWMWTQLGWGHDERFWREFLTALRFVGYDGALSVEMECDYMQVREGFEKAVAFLKPLLLSESPAPGTRWWQVADFHSLVED